MSQQENPVKKIFRILKGSGEPLQAKDFFIIQKGVVVGQPEKIEEISELIFSLRGLDQVTSAECLLDLVRKKGYRLKWRA